MYVQVDTYFYKFVSFKKLEIIYYFEIDSESNRSILQFHNVKTQMPTRLYTREKTKTSE